MLIGSQPPSLTAAFCSGIFKNALDLTFGVFETGRRLEWTYMMAADMRRKDGDHTGPHTPEAATARYLALTETARGTLPAPIAEVALAVCHAAKSRHTAQRLHLERAFETGASVGQMAEAMSYLLLPCGGPVLIDAVAAWEEAAVAGLCPSPYGD